MHLLIMYILSSNIVRSEKPNWKNRQGEFTCPNNEYYSFFSQIHYHKRAKANSAQKREEDRASKGEGGYGEKTGEEREQRKEEEGTGGRKHRS